jgi:hypothetical protein
MACLQFLSKPATTQVVDCLPGRNCLNGRPASAPSRLLRDAALLALPWPASLHSSPQMLLIQCFAGSRHCLLPFRTRRTRCHRFGSAGAVSAVWFFQAIRLGACAAGLPRIRVRPAGLGLLLADGACSSPRAACEGT